MSTRKIVGFKQGTLVYHKNQAITMHTIPYKIVVRYERSPGLGMPHYLIRQGNRVTTEMICPHEDLIRA